MIPARYYSRSDIKVTRPGAITALRDLALTNADKLAISLTFHFFQPLWLSVSIFYYLLTSSSLAA